MNLILFGPPGAGKGTQAKYLVKKLSNYQISTGDMLREEIQKNTEIGKRIVNDMDDGKFVSDEIVNTLIENVLFDSNKKDRLIFDGYPRSLAQAKNLEALLKKSNQKIAEISAKSSLIFGTKVHENSFKNRYKIDKKRDK